MRRPRIRSVSTPIVLTTMAVSLSITLLVGWTLLIAHTLLSGPAVIGGVSLLVSGIASFIFVMAVLVMFGISLVREILESRRQVSFIDSVTHELKSPLASLKLGLQTMARRELSSTQRSKIERMMESDVVRLSAFIDDVLNASRAGSGRMTASVGDVDIADILRGAVSQAVKRYGVSTECVKVAIEQPGLVLTTDGAALKVAVDNLVDNAVKYSDPPVDVCVAARVRGDGKAEIEIVDKGIGIEKRDLKRVFQRFYRVPDVSVKARRGTGLGLYVALAMVRSLGGKVRAESGGKGEGTTMRITLPASLVRR